MKTITKIHDFFFIVLATCLISPAIIAMETEVEHDASCTELNEFIISITEKELLTDSAELTAKLKQAALQGFFYVEIPSALKDRVQDSMNFANRFYKEPSIREGKFEQPTGFYDTESQTETFVCERPNWNLYPEGVQSCASELCALSLALLRKVFPLVLPQLSESDRQKATGGLLDNKGTFFFSLNHYRPAKQVIGANPHQDSGYITLLMINKKGLFAQLKNKAWRAIPPKPGYFVVNFGRAFEILVNDTSKLVASWHFVEQITQEKHGGDRVSVAHFCDNHTDTPVMAVTKDGALEVKFSSYKQYLFDLIASMSQVKVEVPEVKTIENAAYDLGAGDQL